MSAAGDGRSSSWRIEQRQCPLSNLDQPGTSIIMFVSISGILSFIWRCGSHPDAARVALLMAAESMLLFCQLLVATLTLPAYVRHRKLLILLLHTIKFAVVMKYIPLLFAAAKDVFFASGKEVVYAAHVLFMGFASSHMAFDTLTCRLQRYQTVMLTILRFVASTWLLSQHMSALLSDPVIKSIVISWKDMMDCMCDHVMLLLALQESMLSPTVSPCPSTALAFWCHCCIAVLVPLYFITVVHYCAFWRPQVDSYDFRPNDAEINADHLQPPQQQQHESTPGSSVSSSDVITITDRPLITDDDIPAAASDLDQRSSTQTLDSTAGAAVGGTQSLAGNVATTVNDADQNVDHHDPSLFISQQQQQQLWQQGGVMQQLSSVLYRLKSCDGYVGVFHVGVLLISSMLLWVFVDTVMRWDPVADSYDIYSRRACVCDKVWFSGLAAHRLMYLT